MVVLWLGLILLVLGLALLQRQANQYSSSQSLVESSMAYELALAGLETARLRLDKDPEFPPHGVDQVQFSLTEPVYDVDNQSLRGFYVLDLDNRWRQAPYYVVKITSVGCWPNADKPQSRRKISVKLDLNPAHSTYYRWIDWQDEGCL